MGLVSGSVSGSGLLRQAVCLLLIIFTAVCGESNGGKRHKGCDLSPPFLYVTTHDEVPNVLKYTRDGCLLSNDVLVGGPETYDHVIEYRSMALGEYKGEKDVLYIADAMSKESYLLVYSSCDASGHRHYLDRVVSTHINRGADHTYGITFDGDGNVYASFQHTDCVLRFAKDTFTPMHLPLSIQSSKHHKDYFPGTFVQFGLPGVHHVEEQGVRGLARVNNTLYVANEDLGGVMVVDINSGTAYNIIVVHNPIALHYDPISGRLSNYESLLLQYMIYTYHHILFHRSIIRKFQTQTLERSSFRNRSPHLSNM
jgi:hypothetical protein